MSTTVCKGYSVFIIHLPYWSPQLPTEMTLISRCIYTIWTKHDDVIKWKHFPRYWPFVTGIHRSPVDSPHKGQWHEALLFSLNCAWTNGWANNQDAGDLRRNCAHIDVTVMKYAQGVVVLCFVLVCISCSWIHVIDLHLFSMDLAAVYGYEALHIFFNIPFEKEQFNI